MIAPTEPVSVPLPAMHEVMLTKYVVRLCLALLYLSLYSTVRKVPSSRYSSSEGENAEYFGKKDIQGETE